MRLATLRDGSRDGALIVVSSDAARFARAGHVAPHLQAALDDWDVRAPKLEALARQLEADAIASEPLAGAPLAAPLPRAYEWIDASAYLNHVRLVRRARGAEPPATLETEPLVYQGGSSALLGPNDPFPLPDPRYGLDFEAELGVVLGDVAIGTKALEAARAVRLCVCLNDWTYRALVPDELAKGFGFFVSKPATSFAPFAVTPDELGGAFREGRIHGQVHTFRDRVQVGDAFTGEEMHFSFSDLVQHISRTRAFAPGTLLGSGTISNADPARGHTCIQEARAREQLAGASDLTPFLDAGAHVRIEFRLADGRAPFGAIDQRVDSFTTS